MSAVANDDMRLPSMAAFQTMRSLNTADTFELGQIIAAATGALHQRMGPAHVAKVLGRITDELRGENPLTLYEVALSVAAKYRVRVADLIVPDNGAGARRMAFAIPRHEAFWLAYRQVGIHTVHRYSLPQIGAFFGGRDHTTVIHGIRAHEKRMVLAGSYGETA